jgi:DNA repair exonuclease SbcCD ATPase subunit
MAKVKLRKIKPKITYCGSLIQQNHGETIEGHGWCLWDIPTKSHEFIELDNDYGYCTLDISDGIVTLPKKLPKNARLRVFSGDLESTKIKKLLSVIRSKTNVLEVNVTKGKTSTTIQNTKTVNGVEITNLSDINVQEGLLEDWLSTREFPVDDETVKQILNINRTMNANLVLEDYSRNINWQPISFKFSNMFSYGEDNEVNFEKMNGIYGIFSPNASGKSSIMDALMFCLYDKTPRAFKGDHIMNNRKNSFKCELIFKINNTMFVVRRVGTRKKTGEVKVDVEFLRKEQDGSFTCLNGQDRRDTNNNIRSYVGTYEDFVLTAFSGQTSNALFIDKSHSERKDLLCQFMGLNIFDKLAEMANEELKQINAELKKFKSKDFSSKLVEVKEKIDITRDNIKQQEEKLRLSQEELENDTKDYEMLLLKKSPDVNITTDISVLQQKKTKEQYQLKNFESKIDDITKTSKEYSSNIEGLVEQLKLYDIDHITKKIQSLENSEKELSSIRTTIKNLEITLKDKQKLLDKLKSIKYNPECNVCVENNKGFIDQIDVLTNEINVLKNSLEKNKVNEAFITTQVEELDLLRRDLIKFKEITENKSYYETLKLTLSVEFEKISSNIEKQKRTITDIDKEIETYNKNETIISYNKKIQDEIDTLAHKLTKLRKNIEQYTSINTKLHGELMVLETQREQILQEIQEATELELKFLAYKLYLDAVGRNGIPHTFLQKVIPNIETEINNILNQVVEFNISLEMDGKNINGFLNYDYDRIWPLENSSGMERFVSSLAIRVALMNVSNLPKPNFLIIDEGFGTLDAENLHNMTSLMGILKGHFDFIFMVSHLDSVRDMVDNILEIKREEGYSYIKS